MRAKLVRLGLVAALTFGACIVSMRPASALPTDAGAVADASRPVDASSAEPEASTPQDDAGAITFVDAAVSSGADAGVPAVGPDAGPMGSMVSSGCALVAAGGVGVSGWSLGLASVALLGGRRRRRAGR